MFAGHTALQAASQNGHVEAVKVLIKFNANLEAQVRNSNGAFQHSRLDWCYWRIKTETVPSITRLWEMRKKWLKCWERRALIWMRGTRSTRRLCIWLWIEATNRWWLPCSNWAAILLCRWDSGKLDCFVTVCTLWADDSGRWGWYASAWFNQSEEGRHFDCVTRLQSRYFCHQ